MQKEILNRSAQAGPLFKVWSGAPAALELLKNVFSLVLSYSLNNNQKPK